MPIVINRGPNGELVVSSPDTEALDLFEEMINEMGPPRKDYEVFYLKHGFAFWVAARLEDYFEIEDSSKKNNNRYPFYFYDDFGSQSNKSDTRRLSRRRPLKFITDTDTNTILVTGADPNQLRIIEQLIKIYDQPEPMDSRAARMTKTFQLKYSKAKVVGDTVKDVYRDLLSSNDKALQQQQGGDQKNKRPESQNTYITNFGGGEDEGKPTEVRFKGKLSIGTDELSNTLVVSTEGENLMNNVERLIESLDNGRAPIAFHGPRVADPRQHGLQGRAQGADPCPDRSTTAKAAATTPRPAATGPESPAATAADAAATSRRKRRARRAVREGEAPAEPHVRRGSPQCSHLAPLG